MHKRIVVWILITLSLSSHAQQQISAENVASRFEDFSSGIIRAEYKTHRVDSFPGGIVWDNRGVALVEKNASDKVLGFSFYGKRDGMSEQYVYDNGIGFIINDSSRTYETVRAGRGFLGSPGGQLVVQNLFVLDSIYQSRSLEETNEFFVLKYKFKDDTVHDVTSITKSLRLTKNNFFPVSITRSANMQGKRTVTQITLTNVRINEKVSSTIKSKKSALETYALTQRAPVKPNPILGTRLAGLSILDLFNVEETISLPSNTPLLIDFWANWCGPCISSLPNIENLHKKYGGKLLVLGIVFENREEVIRLIEKKKITFKNGIGNPEMMNSFGINSWPRYFLVDRNGVIQKEYLGYSDQIETDIREIIK